MATKKDLTPEEIKMAKDFVKAYDKCMDSTSKMLKICEENTLYLFALEEETKKKKPLKIFRKTYTAWEDLMNSIQKQKKINDKRYMDCLKEIEELIDIKMSFIPERKEKVS